MTYVYHVIPKIIHQSQYHPNHECFPQNNLVLKSEHLQKNLTKQQIYKKFKIRTREKKFKNFFRHSNLPKFVMGGRIGT